MYVEYLGILSKILITFVNGGKKNNVGCRFLDSSFLSNVVFAGIGTD